MTDAVQLGRGAEQSDWLDHVARIGLVAYGAVHLWSGGWPSSWPWVTTARTPAPRVPCPSSRSSRSATRWSGRWRVGLVMLVVWRVVEAAFGHREAEGADRVRKRVSSAGKAVIYARAGRHGHRRSRQRQVRRLRQRLEDDDREADGPAGRTVDRGRGRPGDHRVRRRRRLAWLEGEVRRAPRDRGQARLFRSRLPAPRQGRSHRQGGRLRPSSADCSAMPASPTSRASPGVSTRRCRRCCSSPSGRSC